MYMLPRIIWLVSVTSQRPFKVKEVDGEVRVINRVEDLT